VTEAEERSQMKTGKGNEGDVPVLPQGPSGQSLMPHTRESIGARPARSGLLPHLLEGSEGDLRLLRGCCTHDESPGAGQRGAGCRTAVPLSLMTHSPEKQPAGQWALTLLMMAARKGSLPCTAPLPRFSPPVTSHARTLSLFVCSTGPIGGLGILTSLSSVRWST
jgi:hypothetical protein